MLFAPTSAPAIAPFINSAPSSVAKYLEDDFQQILKTVFDFRPPASFMAFALVSHHKDFCEKPLKARFPDNYRNKTYIEYYNFF